MKKLILSAVSLSLLLLIASSAGAQSISNPYYANPTWKLWATDTTPVTDGTLVTPGQVGIMSTTNLTNMFYPDDIVTPGKYLEYRKIDWGGRKYAGFWDDVYFSVDQNSGDTQPHSWLPGGYYGDVTGLNTIWFGSDWCFRGYKGNIQGDPGIDGFGVNFTSQSTTMMGHDIANSGSNSQYGTTGLEQSWYFKNCLRGGVAHISYVEDKPTQMDDYFKALAPCYYDSLGSSGTEVKGLLKMILTGSYFQKTFKPELKRQGIYIATLLYIFKACLPYDAPYDSEVRHRVCYASDGGYVPPVNAYAREYHLYNDSAHLAAMIAMAKNMTVAPPISLIREVATLVGTKTYFNKTCALYEYGLNQGVQVRVSVSDSYDIAGRPLTFKVTKICGGTPQTTIVDEGGGNYLVTQPFYAGLPNCRTSILFIANNGIYDSNPAVLNLYYSGGSAVNQRPIYTGEQNKTVSPGGTVTYNLSASDPEGFQCSIYKKTQDLGTISGNTWTWTCPTSISLGAKLVPLLISDGTTGVNSTYLTVNVGYSGSTTSDEFALLKSFPNPVNLTTGGTAKVIGLTGNCVVTIYDSNGTRIRELREADQPAPNAGQVEWDGKNENGETVSRGMYMYVATSPAGSKKTKKIAILK